MATEDDVATGLLDWVNSLNLADPVKSIESLSDGYVLWLLLQEVDGFSFPGNLPEKQQVDGEWVYKWTNIKHLYDALTIFLVEQCDQKLPLFYVAGRTRPDLKAIAQHGSLPDTILLLKLCVIAAINCDDRIEFLKRMQELDEGTQRVLMDTAQEAGESAAEQEAESLDDFGADFDDNHTSSSIQPVTIDLASEERLANVIADNQRLDFEKRELQKQLDDLFLRYNNLQSKSDRSQEELNEASERLAAVLSGQTEIATHKGTDPNSESVIAALEARCLQAETDSEEFRKVNEVLKIKADRLQKLQDDFDEIRIDRDKLSRKANAAEKYRQKLESIQEIEKENTALKSKVSELQGHVKQSDSSQASTSNLQREVDEYRRLLPSIEQERYDLNEMKKRLEFDYHTLEARWHDLNDEHQRAKGVIESLQERLREYEDDEAPTTPTRSQVTTAPDLEADEAAFIAAEARLTEALLKDTVPNKSEENAEEQNGISEDELRAIMSAMHAQAQAGSASARETGLQAQKKLLIALDRQRTRNLSLVEHVKQQTELIADLKKVESQQDSATDKSGYPPQIQKSSVAGSTTSGSKLLDLLEMNENLKREIRLMTSAWYEQNQRIAASSAGGGAVMSLMRSKGSRMGAEEPRSFLGRQRKVIDGVVLGGSVAIPG